MLLPVILFMALRPAPVLAAPARVIYGFDREFPPFSYEAPGGKATGFDVELLEAVFKEADVDLTFRPLQWEGIATELASGAISLTTGMVRTEQRQKLYLFSDRPSFALRIKLFTKVYARLPSLNLFKGLMVSVEQGTFQHRLLQYIGGFNIKPFALRLDGIKALFNDQVNAYCGPVENTYYYINKLELGAITTAGTPLALVPMHIAVTRGRGDVLRMVNAGFKTVYDSGEYHRLYRKWFVRELSEADIRVMLDAAAQASVPAYAPYERKAHGAALLTATGKVYSACTVENADPAMTIPAISAALARTVAEGEFELRAAVLVDQSGAILPLARGDLQALYEFGPGLLIIAAGPDGFVETHMISQLLKDPVVKISTPLMPE